MKGQGCQVSAKKPPPFRRITFSTQTLQIGFIVGISFTKGMPWNYVIDRVTFSTTRLACVTVSDQYALAYASPL